MFVSISKWPLSSSVEDWKKDDYDQSSRFRIEKKRLLLTVCDVFGWQSQRAVSVDVQDSIAVVCRPQEAKYFDFKHVAESSLNIIFLELDSVLFGALH